MTNYEILQLVLTHCVQELQLSDQGGCINVTVSDNTITIKRPCGVTEIEVV